MKIERNKTLEDHMICIETRPIYFFLGKNHVLQNLFIFLFEINFVVVFRLF
jgi:hypothetical protein